MPTVIEHVLGRLREIGVADVFGVPGDYSFGVSDAVVAHPDLAWIGCSNELNAAYAADGYARIKGAAAGRTRIIAKFLMLSKTAGSARPSRR